MAETSNDLQKCGNRLVKREIKLPNFPFLHVKKKYPAQACFLLKAYRGTAVCKVP